MRRWILTALVALVAALAGVGATLLVLSRSSGQATLSGELQIAGIDHIAGSNIDCYGGRGYTELREGANVVVTDASGATVAVTSLQAGKWENRDGITYCRLPFSVRVPSGKGFYGVEVAHRGRVQFTEAQLGAAVVTIGG